MRRFWILIALLFLGPTATASACSCVRLEPWVPEPPAFVAQVIYADQSAEVASAWMLIEKGWGVVGPELVEVQTDVGTSCSVDFPALGERFVVFGDRDLTEPISVSSCSDAGAARRYREALAELGEPSWERPLDAASIERHTAEIVETVSAGRVCGHPEAFEATVRWGESTQAGEAPIEGPLGDRDLGRLMWIPRLRGVTWSAARIQFDNPFDCWLEICAAATVDGQPVEWLESGAPRCSIAAPRAFHRHKGQLAIESETPVEISFELSFQQHKVGPTISPTDEP